MLKLGSLVMSMGCLLVALTTAAADTPLTTVEVATGLTSPIFVTSPPGDTSRLFVAEQSGRIKIIKTGTLLPQPFLDMSAHISTGGERGLLGLAFHPGYDTNGFFYVNYTDSAGDTRVARFQVSGDPDLADAGSELEILTVAQPYANHNAGMLAFSPVDGYLYVGQGDGGAGGDPNNFAQNPMSLLGKMLRLDVDGGSPYTVPPDNPFVGSIDTLPEIWAFGLRNPWRYSFDRSFGHLYIGDVGQNSIEEVDFQDSASTGGENYGWRLKEGTACYNPPTNCDPGGLIDPIHEYSHGGSPNRCSVTGGYVYRGCAIPDLQGTYFFGDYCSGQVWSFRYDGSTVTEFADRTSELGLSAIISSFGEDANGELYVVDYTGRILKIVPDGVPSQCSADCCSDRGNVDGLETVPGLPITLDDLTYLVAYLFSGGPAPPCPDEGNVDGLWDGSFAIAVADVTYLVAFLFSGGDAPPGCPI